MTDHMRDALGVLLSLLACAGILAIAGAVGRWSPARRLLPVPNCTHPVSLGDQPYCPTPVPTP